jgi:imidazolonepropionase-like amidohydrolase
MRNFAIKILVFGFFLFEGTFFSNAQETFVSNGPLDRRHITLAFINASIHPEPGSIILNARLIIKDGSIVAVGADVVVPDNATVYDLKGMHIYPSFIDLFSDYGMPEVAKREEGREVQYENKNKGAHGWNEALKSDFAAYRELKSDTKKLEQLRKMGFGALNVLRCDGISRGTSSLVYLSDEKENKSIALKNSFACLSFDKGSSAQEYPSSQMGAIALLRQTYLDGQWYAQQNAEVNLQLEAWNQQEKLPVIFEVSDHLSGLRALAIAKEYKKDFILKGQGDEYLSAKEFAAQQAKLILSLQFPEAYDVTDPYDGLSLSLKELKHWECAPFNAVYLSKEKVAFCFTAFDLKKKDDFRKNILKIVALGLSPDEAMRALTTRPASWLKMSEKVGALKVGMVANFNIYTEDFFAKDAILKETWVMGEKCFQEDMVSSDIRGNYELNLGNEKGLKLNVGGKKYKPEFIVLSDTAKIKTTAQWVQDGLQLSFVLPKNASIQGLVRMNGQISNGTLKGKALMPNGSWVNWSLYKLSNFVEKPDTAVKKAMPLLPELSFPNMAYGFKKLPDKKTYLIKNVTVWTNEKEGILKSTDVLIADGKISKVGSINEAEVKSLSGLILVDGSGKHLSPGMIDEHSHIAISGNVNEGTQSVSAEVRIGDVVDPEDVNIYRQLGGGVTCSQLLHGSANAVGGQSQLIKLRWGSTAEQMKFEGADSFIKFALGENVKQSNWGDRNVIRYPQTRMGVEQIYMDAFFRAREYDEKKKISTVSNPGETKKVFRKDLELEALAEILNKKRFITCHSYQQGEINMLMHVADSFGFQVNTFTHILEGYKVADKMKKHGVGASTFADWWGYKYEVIEAVPHNASLLNSMGIVTAVNSDDAEMARRLNQEAAKGIRYGGMTEEDALKLVTLNPAKLLHVDHRVGSIKVGKDADLVLWSAPPLSIYAKVEKTFVDGKLYFDLEQDGQSRKEIALERSRLLQKMQEEKTGGSELGKPAQKIQKMNHCNDQEVYSHP